MAATQEKVEDVRAALDSLKADVASLKDDIRGLAGAMENAGKHKLSAAKERVIEQAKAVEDEAQRRVVGAYEDVREVGDHALNATRRSIEDRPLTAALGAFLAGMLFAKLMWRD